MQLLLALIFNNKPTTKETSAGGFQDQMEAGDKGEKISPGGGKGIWEGRGRLHMFGREG